MINGSRHGTFGFCRMLHNEPRWFARINRAVRRAMLCGMDRHSGKSYEHRRGWIKNRLVYLAKHYGIDVLGYAIMGNHMHVILRNRPDVVAT